MLKSGRELSELVRVGLLIILKGFQSFLRKKLSELVGVALLIVLKGFHSFLRGKNSQHDATGL